MKFFKDSANTVFAYNEDGSQDHLIGNKIAITKEEADELARAVQQAHWDEQDYYRKRLYSYPEMGEFVDAWVKNDTAALEEYRQKCLAVKAKYPKPAGF